MESTTDEEREDMVVDEQSSSRSQTEDSLSMNTLTNTNDQASGESDGRLMEAAQANTTNTNREQHVITSPTGHQYVAHIYEEGADGQPVEGTGTGQEESSIARKLCLNLLNEFVKGNHLSSKAPNHSEAAAASNDQGDNAKEQEGDFASKSTCQQPKPLPSTASSTSAKHSDEPPFKKAKFGWQIKNSQKQDTQSSDSEESDNDGIVDLVQMNETTEGSSMSEMPSDSTNRSLDASSPTSDSNDSPVVEFDNTLWSEHNRIFGSQSTTPLTNTINESNNPFTGQNAAKYDRLQSHHIAKSIVDNAINRTLEEMGLSPDQIENQSRQQFRQQRQQVEDVGVAEVIRERGLQQRSQAQLLAGAPFQPLHRGMQNPQTAAQRLHPLISRLTEVSENMFVRNVRQGLRVSTRIELGSMNTTGTDDDDDDQDTPVTTSTTNTLSQLNSIDEIPQTSQTPTSSVLMTEHFNAEDAIRNSSTSAAFVPDIPGMQDNTPGDSPAMSEVGYNSSAEDEVIIPSSGAPGADIEKIEKERLSSSYILDRALNAAITERGLRY